MKLHNGALFASVQCLNTLQLQRFVTFPEKTLKKIVKNQKKCLSLE